MKIVISAKQFEPGTFFQADPDKLLEWSKRILDAQSLDEVLH